jgi:LuxR family maltose regulon positive regulatory protein
MRGTIHREKLANEFQNLFQYNALFVIAPFGYGKTIATEQFVNSVPDVESTLLSIEEGDNKLEYIWACCLAFLQETIGIMYFDFPYTQEEKNRVCKYIQRLCSKKKKILIIDNYHNICNSYIDKLIEYVINKDIVNFHLIIISRKLPNITISDFLIKQKVYLINKHLFELSVSETQDYLFQNGIRTDLSEAKKINELSEGWISAVYMIGENYYLKKYIDVSKTYPLVKESIINGYNKIEIEQLSRLSLLEGFSSNDLKSIVENIYHDKINYICQNNNFISYDVTQQNYVMHNILKSYLINYFSHIDDNGINKKEIFSRIGKMYIQKNNSIKGINYFLLAEEYQLILEEFQKDYTQNLFDTYPEYMCKVFNTIPKVIRYSKLDSNLNYLFFISFTYEMENRNEIISEMELYYLNESEDLDEKKEIFKDELNNLEEALSKSSLQRIKDKAFYNTTSILHNLNAIPTRGSVSILYSYYKTSDQGARKILYSFVDKFDNVHELFFYGKNDSRLLLVVAEYYLQITEYEHAKKLANIALELGYKKNEFDIVVCSEFILSRIYFSEINSTDAVNNLKKLYSNQRIREKPMIINQLNIAYSFMGILLKRENLIVGWVKNYDFKKSKTSFICKNQDYLISCRTLLMRKEYIKLELLLDDFYQETQKLQNRLGLFHVFILRSIVFFEANETEKALDEFKLVLDFINNERFLTSFAEYGDDILPVLMCYKRSRINNKLVNELLYLTFKYSSLEEKALLTEREQQVLKLLSMGKTYNEISDSLFISLSTVKKHIISSYRKLGVSNKVNAIKKAKELNII